MGFGKQVVSAKIANEDIGQKTCWWVGGLLDVSRLLETPIRSLNLILLGYNFGF